jgi:cob(I)alamin adenosyltransferase
MAEHDRSAKAGGPFHDPHVSINRVYTKKGDKGDTSLVGGQKVPKDDLRIEAYGTVDELNSIIGAARVSALDFTRARETLHDGLGAPADLVKLAAILLRVQHELFNLGSLLATMPEDLRPGQPRVTDKDVEALEREMDEAGKGLPALRSFVLPGGTRLNTDLHLARTVCRRAERCAVALARTSEVDPVAIRYLNRLSDALFVWSRLACAAADVEEVLWTPNAGASGSGA